MGRSWLRAHHFPMQIPALPSKFLTHSKLSFLSSYLGDKAPFLPGSCKDQRRCCGYFQGGFERQPGQSQVDPELHEVAVQGVVVGAGVHTYGRVRKPRGSGEGQRGPGDTQGAKAVSPESGRGSRTQSRDGDTPGKRKDACAGHQHPVTPKDLGLATVCLSQTRSQESGSLGCGRL